MRIGRTLSPTAAPLDLVDLWNGCKGIFGGKGARERLEKEFGAYFGVKHAFLVSSGKAALTLIFQALKGLSDRREVVLPAYTCFSVPAAAVKAGLRLKLCDIHPETMDFDFKALESVVSDETLCVIPTHLFGRPVDVQRTLAAARAASSFVVEDASQAQGVQQEHRFLGTMGDVGFFSFGRGKVVSCGDGGLILTNSDNIAGALRTLHGALGTNSMVSELFHWFKIAVMSLFMHPNLYWFPAGLPFLRLGETIYPENFPVQKLSSMEVGLLCDWRRRLEASTSARQACARYYRESLPESHSQGNDGAALRFPLLAPDKSSREALLHRSARAGLGLGSMYPSTLNLIAEIRHLFRAGERYPSAELLVTRLLTLPTHQFMTRRDLRRVVDLVKSAGTQLESSA